jgi:membrane protein YdbS with pleckstrin-like domain
MSFINAPVAVGDLPQVESVSLQPIQPAYLKVLRIEWLITTVILAIVAAVLIFAIPSIRNSYGWLALAGAVIIVSAVNYFFKEKSFPYKKFAVRGKDVIYQSGWLINTTRTCPFNRIQNCTVQTGPLERKYGLAALIIYTAGSDGADMRIPGLLQEEADKLRYFILEQIHKEAHEEL